jgi:hypothetical protein
MEATGIKKCKSSKMVTLKALNSKLLHQFTKKGRPQGFAWLDVPANYIPTSGE